MKQVEIGKPNPQYAALFQEQLGGGNGELKAAKQYMSQRFRIKNTEIKDLSMLPGIHGQLTMSRLQGICVLTFCQI